MKNFLIVLVSIVVLIIGGGILFINPILERAKPTLLASIQEPLGVPLDIESIEVSIFPNPGFTLKGIQTGSGNLENKIEEAQLFVSLPSLLGGKVEIASFALSGGSLKAIKTKEGKFLFLKADKLDSNSAETTTPIKQVDNTGAKGGSQESKLPLKISKATIDDVKVEIYDELHQTSIAIDNLKATANEDGLDTVIVSEILAGKDTVDVTARLLESDLNRVEVDLSFLVSDISRWLVTFVKEPLPAKVEGGLSGKLKFKKELDKNSLSDIKLNLQSLGVIFKEFFDKKVGESLDVSFDSIKLGEEILLKGLGVEFKGADLDIDDLSLHTTNSSFTQSGLKSLFDLDELKSSVPILNQYPIKGKIDLSTATENHLALNIDANYDSAIFNLSGQLKNFGGSVATLKDRPLNLLFKLNKSNVMDLLKVAGKAEDFKYSGTLAETNCEIVRESDGGLINVSCKGEQSEINSTKLILNKVLVKILEKKEGKDLDVSPLVLNIGAEGVLNLEFKQGALGNKQIGLELQKSSLTDLLSLAPTEGSQKLPISGLLNKASVDLSGDKALSGTYSASLTDFSIIGFNLFTKVASALDKIPGIKEAMTNSLPDSYKVILLAENSNFSTANIKGSLSGPNVEIQSLTAQSKGYHIEGKGGIKAGDLNFDIDLVIDKELVTILESRSKEISKIKSFDGTILIPVTISKSKDGTPLVYPNMEKLLKSQATAQVREQGKKALEKVMPGLGGVVDGFFGN